MKTIKCPKCGREYLPGEIFIPEYFLGKPKEVERDLYGNIIFTNGIEQNLSETYVCDGCKAILKIQANITYTITEDKTNNINEEYKTNLYNGELFLKEE